MQKLNKPFEPITTLIIIYFVLLAVSIALYALIQIFFKKDTATASSLLGWSATMFATIALLYTVNIWKDQKQSEVIAYEAKLFFVELNLLKNVINIFITKNDLVSEEEFQNQVKVFGYLTKNVDEKIKLLDMQLICDNNSIILKYIDYRDKIWKNLNIKSTNHGGLPMFLISFQTEVKNLKDFEDIIDKLITLSVELALYKQTKKF
ncbi:hypothetical protein [Acinetobacter cumulans]|nr:hypothetical protein [Acinetobacter cumulans]